MKNIVKKSALLGAAVLAVAGLSFAGQEGWDTYKTNTDVDMSWTGYSPCVPADKIVVTGKEHLTSNITTDHAGQYKIDMHGNHNNVKGVSEMGVEYVVPGFYNLHIDHRGEAASSTFKYQVYCPLISKGKAPNFKWHMWRQVHVTSDGKISLEKYKEEARCVGDTRDDEKPGANVEN